MSSDYLLMANYKELRNSIRNKHREYKYFAGEITNGSNDEKTDKGKRRKNLLEFYDKHPRFEPAATLINTEWNEAFKDFQRKKKYTATIKGEEFAETKKMLRKKVKEAEKIEEKIYKSIGATQKYSELSMSDKIKRWNNFFLNQENIDNKQVSLMDILTTAALDGKAKSYFFSIVAMHSRNFTNFETHSESRRAVNNILRDAQKQIKKKEVKDDNFIYKLGDSLEKELLKLGDNLTGEASVAAKNYMEALTGIETKEKTFGKGNVQQITNEIRDTFKDVVEDFIKENNLREKNAGKNIEVKVNETDKGPFFTYKIVNADQLQLIEEASKNFFDNLEIDIRELKEGKNYKKIGSNDTIKITSQMKEDALTYLKNNKKKLIKDMAFYYARNSSVVTGQIGELLTYFQLLNKKENKHLSEVRSIGSANNFADMAVDFKINGEKISKGINVKRFVSKTGNAYSFTLYNKQTIQNSNYKHYFSSDEIKLLNYIKANNNIVKYFAKGNIKNPENFHEKFNFPKKSDWYNEWQGMLVSHITDFCRITTANKNLGIDENLFFVINNTYYPVSLIYRYLLKQFDQGVKVSDFFSKIQGLTEGQPIRYRAKDSKNLLISNSAKDFTAQFTGFVFNLRKLLK